MKYKRLFIIILILFLFVVFPSETRSERLGISIDQAIFAFDIEAGTSDQFKLMVTNVDGGAQDVGIDISNFEIGENSQVRLITEENEVGIKDWIKVDKVNHSLDSNEQVEVVFTIEVPETAEVGSHYAVVLASGSHDDEPTTSTTEISGRVGAFVLVNVKGDLDGRGRINSFTAERSLIYDKANLLIEFENTGNIHYIPSGKVSIKNILSRDEYERQLDQHFVFPGKKYVFEFSEDFKTPLGIYRAKVTMVDGDGIEHTNSLYLMSIWLMVLIALVFLVLITLIVFWQKIRGKKNVEESNVQEYEADEKLYESD